MACLSPITLRNTGYHDNPAAEYTQNLVPCGKCAKCLQKRSREWIYRIKQELKISASAFFVTLTYDDQSLMWSNSGVPTLCKKDFQDFMKRLRNLQWRQNPEDHKIKYYACGEYGDKTHRPHYHAIILNSYEHLFQKAWEVEGRTLGIVHVGTVTQDSIAYNTKYILKGKTDWQKQFKDDPSFQPQFSLMSKGLGANYMKPAVVKYHKANLDKNYIVDEQGFKYNMPRYYAKKMFTEKELKTIKKLARKYHEEKHKPIEDFKQDLESRQHQNYLLNKRITKKSDKL